VTRTKKLLQISSERILLMSEFNHKSGGCMSISSKVVVVLMSALALCFFVLVSCSQTEKQADTEVQAEVALAAADSTADAAPVAWNKVCPITGEEVAEDTPIITYDGKAYGFCCQGCDKKFTKDPENLAKNLSEDGTTFIGKKS